MAASRLEDPLLAVTEQGAFKSTQETGIYPLDRMVRGHKIPKPGKYAYSTDNARFYMLRGSVLDNMDLTFPVANEPDDLDDPDE